MAFRVMISDDDVAKRDLVKVAFPALLGPYFQDHGIPVHPFGTSLNFLESF